MRERTRKAAQRFNILPQLNKLEGDLLSVPGVTEVDFDLDGLHQVIFLTRYDIPVVADDYSSQRRQLIHSVLNAAALNGLSKTEDTIEDYGEWLYFVFHCGPEWKIALPEEDLMGTFLPDVASEGNEITFIEEC